MCVLALAWRAHPRWHLVIAGNRDELHARPAQPLARWEEPEHILAGRDLQSGGTWLGVSEQGRFAVITNLAGFGPPQAGTPSRGALLSDLLSGRGRYADPSEAELIDFSPFNMISVDRGQAEFWSNRPTPVRRNLPPGTYGLSNGTLDEPWPKTALLKTFLLDWFAGDATHPELLLDGLREETLLRAGDPSALPSDGVRDPARSPIFIRDPVYGTRCSTVLAIDDRGRGSIVERRFAQNGDEEGETSLSFSWPQ